MKTLQIVFLLSFLLTCGVSWAQDSSSSAHRIPTLVKKLASKDFGVRESAHKDLITLGLKAVPALKKALKSKDPEVKIRVQDILQKIRRNECLRQLRSPKIDIREQALEQYFADEHSEADLIALLTKHMDKRLAPLLTDILQTLTHNGLRNQCRTWLKQIGPPESVLGLYWVFLGADSIGHSPGSPGEDLMHQADPRLLPDLLILKKHGRSVDKIVSAIRKRHPNTKTPKTPLVDLDKILHDAEKGPTVKLQVRAIRKIMTGLQWHKQASMTLAKTLKDPAVKVRRAAIQAFQNMNIEGHEDALLETARTEKHRLTKIEALLALARSAKANVLKYLVELLDSKDKELQRVAASVLGDNGTAAIAKQLEALAQSSKDPELAKQCRISALRIRARAKPRK